jgi:hypothetical protein
MIARSATRPPFKPSTVGEPSAPVHAGDFKGGKTTFGEPSAPVHAGDFKGGVDKTTFDPRTEGPRRER